MADWQTVERDLCLLKPKPSQFYRFAFSPILLLLAICSLITHLGSWHDAHFIGTENTGQVP